MLRLLLSLAALVVFALLVWGGSRGWRHRAERQEAVTGAFPPAPADPGPVLHGPTTGLYVGSTIAGDWQDRVTVGDIGHRAAGALTLHQHGLLVQRDGASSIWLPLSAVQGIRTDQKLAGKVTLKGGLLVLRWAVGGAVVDTGFRGDGIDDYPGWLTAVQARLTTPDTSDDVKEQQA